MFLRNFQLYFTGTPIPEVFKIFEKKGNAGSTTQKTLARKLSEPLEPCRVYLSWYNLKTQGVLIVSKIKYINNSF